MKDTIGNKFLLLNSVIRPLTEAETASYGHTGTHRLDIVFRLNGNTDFEFADVFNQGG